MNPDLNLSLIALPSPSFYLPTNLVLNIFSKPLQNLPNLILIKPTQFNPLIKPQYHL